MNLIKRQSTAAAPFFPTNIEDEIATFQKEMNSLVNSFFNRGEFMPMLSMNIPAMDLQEKGNKYLLDVDVPGMSESDIDIDLHEHVLTIKGNKKSEKETKKEGYLCVERSQGSFQREVYLDGDIDKDNVKAELKNGVLHIEVTKKDSGRNNHKKIPIHH